MKKILYVIVVLLIIGFIWSYSKKETPVDPQTNNPSDVPSNTDGTTTTFTGTISAVDTGCFVDAECSVTVDGKKVILLAGMRLGEPQEVGTIKGVESIGDLEAKIGSTAKVYAAKTADGYTLYGSNDYYVEVL